MASQTEAAKEPNVTRGGTLHPAAEAPDRESQRPQVPEDDDRPAREGRELVEAAARAGNGRDKLSKEEQVDALEWFLSDTDEVDLEHSFELNVGSPTHKRWLTWTIRPVDLDRLRRIRRESSQQSRRQRIAGTGGFDGDKANIQIVVEGTVRPDLRDAAKQIGLVDPSDAVKSRFKHKPGLIDQIAGEIMSLSGYDDEDVREVDAARG